MLFFQFCANVRVFGVITAELLVVVTPHTRISQTFKQINVLSMLLTWFQSFLIFLPSPSSYVDNDLNIRFTIRKIGRLQDPASAEVARSRENKFYRQRRSSLSCWSHFLGGCIQTESAYLKALIPACVLSSAASSTTEWTKGNGCE